MIDWSRHLKHENPDFSPTFNGIVNRLGDYFDVGARARAALCSCCCAGVDCEERPRTHTSLLTAAPNYGCATDVYATRLNFYRDGTDWKPWHHDSHAYGE